MKSDEFQDLAALWSASTAADEEEALRQVAARTPRMARLSRWGELAVVSLLAGTIALSIVRNLGPATMLLGSLVLVVLGWTAWKRHHLGNLALLIDTRDRVSFIRSNVKSKEAELNRSAIGLAFVLPATLLTMLLGFSLHQERGGGGDLVSFLYAVVTTERGLVALGFLLCALMMLALSHIRLMGELSRMRRLLDDYEAEARLDVFLGR